MKKLWAVIIVLLFSSNGLFAGELVVGKYAGAFMETGVGARMLGMGGAGVAVVEDVTALYWNPAALIWMETPQFHGMHSERFSGIVNWDFVGVGLPVRGNSALALGFFRMGVDGIPLTALQDPTRELGAIYIDEQGRRVQNEDYAYGYVDDSEMAFVLSYARKRSASFSFGGNVKIIRKSVGVADAWGIGFDLGVLLHPYRSMRVGIALFDGTTTLLAWDGGRREVITPQVRAGAAYPFHWRAFSFLPALDLIGNLQNRGAESQVDLGSVGLAFRTGLEIGYRERVALRLGLDRGRFTAGAGLRLFAVTMDYGFSNHLDLGSTHRISMTLSWDKNHLLKL